MYCICHSAYFSSDTSYDEVYKQRHIFNEIIQMSITKKKFGIIYILTCQ